MGAGGYMKLANKADMGHENLRSTTKMCQYQLEQNSRLKKKQQYMSLNYSHGKSPNTCETHVIVKLQTHLGKL